MEIVNVYVMYAQSLVSLKPSLECGLLHSEHLSWHPWERGSVLLKSTKTFRIGSIHGTFGSTPAAVRFRVAKAAAKRRRGPQRNLLAKHSSLEKTKAI